MATYWITFRIEYEEVGGKSYQQRYDAFIDKLDALSTKWWPETTSFVAFESSYGIDALTAALKASIMPSKDLFLIRAMDNKEARVVGANSNPNIHEMMDYLKKA